MKKFFEFFSKKPEPFAPLFALYLRKHNATDAKGGAKMKKTTFYGWIALLLARIYKEDRAKTSIPERKNADAENGNRKNRKSN